METAPPDPDSIKANLVQAYNRMAHLRDMDRVDEWKGRVRREFAALMMKEGRTRLLDLGSGTGRDAVWFQETGLEVTCIDIAPKMVEVCRRKGLKAEVMDIAEMRLEPQSYDAAYALNALVHFPYDLLSGTLEAIRAVLKPAGLVYLGQYGGSDFEGVLERDNYRPRRFFSFPAETRLKSGIEPVFTLESFETIELPGRDFVFYSAVLRK